MDSVLTVGRYGIDEWLASGAMGVVFRGYDPILDRPVAIKICKEAFLDRFEQESRCIASISHPNVCTLYDVGPNYLVMELVEGETLAARLKRGKLSINETIRFAAQIAEALAVAHAKGIIHRDLKPANIMLSKSGVKVLDFGLAKSAMDPSLTAAGGVMGTPVYMAPERLEGKEADVRSDIYALGLILAEMTSGKRSKSPENLPVGLDRVVNRCLEADPDERWQCARDLKWELEAAHAPAAAASRPRNAVLAGALGVAALLLSTFLYFRGQSASQPVTRVTFCFPKSHSSDRLQFLRMGALLLWFWSRTGNSRSGFALSMRWNWLRWLEPRMRAIRSGRRTANLLPSLPMPS